MNDICCVSTHCNHQILVSEPDESDGEGENDEPDPNAGRFVRYQFTPHFLKLKTVGAT